MDKATFAAKRRAARSSGAFRLALLCSLLFLLLLSWGKDSLPSSRPAWLRSDLGATRHRKPDLDIQLDHIAQVRDGAQVVMTPDTPVSHAKATHPGSMPLRIISYNIRYATQQPVPGEQPWAVRCPAMGTQLRFITAGHESPFLCLQEALYGQVHDLQAQLGPSWAHIGRGRDIGEADGEFSPIFYRPDVWQCIRSETRWLSPTPYKPSRGWDAALNRIVTMGEFSHNATGTRIVVMSTHFDHMGVVARANSAKLLIAFAREWRAGVESSEPPSAVLIGGDFNSTPDDEAYRVMTAPGSGMSDVSNLLPRDRHYGNYMTYTSFGEPGEVPMRIDFLFIQEPRTARVDTFGVLANSFDDQIRLSDHRPVVADLQITV
ncbi:hypothetical protein HIM_02924 [Hirsutella minnesotensis 3608]|nr:hypothetical protein HIM_02924 [Hirsutella minnesotensis 3608]